MEHSYNESFIRGTLEVMVALSEGKTPEEALERSYKFVDSVNIAIPMANAVTQFHARGEEFRQYWNIVKSYAPIKKVA